MGSIEIRAVPRTDDSFGRTVMDVANGLAPRDPATLERALRGAYPGVRVTVQSSLASLGNGTVWYVFRDAAAAGTPEADADSSLPRPIEATG